MCVHSHEWLGLSRYEKDRYVVLKQLTRQLPYLYSLL